jgi:NADH:ubiquinone oxidoreductase subunit 3 (subunit A)
MPGGNTTATLTILLSSAIIVLATLISKKINVDREKRSPFECGFDPKIQHDYLSHHDFS